MKNKKRLGIRILPVKLIIAFYLVSVVVIGTNFVYAQGKIASDSEGVVLGASVARSPNEKLSKLPVETYFGNPNIENVDNQLKNLNVVVYPQDDVTSFPDPQMKLGSVIRVTRATPVKIIDGKKEIEVRTWDKVVGQMLENNKIEIGQNDKISVNLSSDLVPNSVIAITRVELTKVSQKEPIAYKTLKKDDPTIDKGLKKTLQVGKNGEREKVFEVRRENGEEVERKLISNEIVTQSVDEIVAIGTKEVVYGTGKATWFGAPPMTAAHNSLPRGTKVVVTSIKTGKSIEVTVIGGGIQGSAIIDLSPDAFEKLAPLGDGIMQVRLTKP